eukprot:TRINITY_DN3430_c0_g1_i1.p1 TRINITY_DN3430_c0_g1~~TRINITY_DN3430_c0_g1_i1.p1  ORF type:complete len:230 (-),score=38.39 TRINITY_DN3430_c0_g1_i1:133-789(-)
MSDPMSAPLLQQPASLYPAPPASVYAPYAPQAAEPGYASMVPMVVVPAGPSAPVPQQHQGPFVKPTNPKAIGIVYDAAISESAQCLYACCTLNYCCWSSVKERMYVQVQENRIETNFPYCSPCCCCMCQVRDHVNVFYFDRIDSVTHATCCTPYHCCCCVACCGEVAALSDGCCNNACCPCCRTYIPGLVNASEFAAMATQARTAALAGVRMGAVRMV